MVSAADQLRGLVLSAVEIKSITNWPDALVEDYLNIINNIVTLAGEIDDITEKKIEETETDFTDGSVPFASGGFLIENNSNFKWDNSLLKLSLTNLDVTDNATFEDALTSAYHYFRNTLIGITSQNDGYLDLFGNIGVRIGDSTSGTPTNYLNISPTGFLTFVAGARYVEKRNINTDGFTLGSTPPASAIIGNFPVFQFDGAGATEEIHTSLLVDDSWDLTQDIDLYVNWAPTNANAGDVVWQLDWNPVADGELITGAGTTESVTDSSQTTQDQRQVTSALTITSADLSNADLIGIRLYRDSTDASDTYASDASFISLQANITKTSLGANV